MTLKLTILGCGSSGGVPRLPFDWGKCDPQNPKNRRRRCSALVQRFGRNGVTSVIIDTGPDVREQLLTQRLPAIDGVLYTHDHADHTHGIDDLRMLAYAMKRRVPAWMDQATLESLISRFGYCFHTPAGGSYPPIMTAHAIEPGHPIVIDGPGGHLTALPVQQEHGDINALGFRFGNLAYSPDISGLSESSIALLAGLDVWIVDALRDIPHPSHFTVKQALEWVQRIAPKRAILTHLHIDLDYDALKRRLPPHVEPAYDGMEMEFSA